MATSNFNFYGNADDGYQARHKVTRRNVEVCKNAEGLWTATFYGRPRHPQTGLRCGTGMCLRIPVEGTFKTRGQAADAAFELHQVEWAQPMGT